MATPAVTPQASAAPAAAPASAPASTPAAAPVSPAPASPPSQAPAAGAEALKSNKPSDIAAFLKTRMDAVGDGPTEPFADDAAPIVGEPAEQGSDTPAPGLEENAPEPAAGGDVPEPAAGNEPTTEPSGEDEEFTLDARPGPLPPSELNEKIKATPELKAALDRDPEFKNRLFAASRLAAEANEYRQVFTSPAEAKVAAQGHVEYMNLADHLTNVRDTTSAQAMVQAMVEASYVLDDDGNPALDAQGRKVSDGSVGRFAHHLFDLQLGLLATQAANDPEYAAALDVLQARVFGRGSASTNEDMTEDQRAQAEQLNQRKAALDEREAQQRQNATAQYESRIIQGIDAHVDGEVLKLLAKSGIGESARPNLVAQIRSALYEKVRDNTQFQAENDLLSRRPQSEKTQEQRIALAKNYVGRLLTDTARKVLADAGQSLISEQQRKSQLQADRNNSSRSEIHGAPAKPSMAKQTPAQENAAVAATLRTRLNREPKPQEVLAEVLKQRMLKSA